MKMKKRVLAVIALALLIINILPVKVAEAAETMDFIVPWYGVDTPVSNEGYEYYFISYGDAYSIGGTRVFFSNTPFVGDVYNTSCTFYPSYGSILAYGMNSSKKNLNENKDLYMGSNNIATKFTSYASNCGIVDKNGKVLLAPNSYIPPTVYTSSSPYLKDITYSYSNLFYLDGNDDFDESYFHYMSNIGNNSSGYIERSVKISGYVCMPSQSFVNEMLSKYGTGVSNLKDFMHIASGAYFPDWLASVDLGDGTSFKKWYFTMDVPCGNVFDLSITNQELFDLVEKYNEVDLVEYYGCSGNPYMEDVLKCYMWIHRLDGVITDTYSDTIVYGNCTSFMFLTFSNEVIMALGYSDPNSFGPPVDFVGPMLPDSTLQPSIDSAYKDAIKDAQVEYEYNLNLDADSEDVFKLFGSLSEGIKNMSGSFRDISIAIGNVFSFFPQEITYIIYAGFIAMIVIAIYKALRG